MYHDNWWGMLMMWFLWLLILVVVIVLLVKLVDSSNIFGSRRGEEKESPMDILKRRYAIGEITTEEFEKQKEILKKS